MMITGHTRKKEMMMKNISPLKCPKNLSRRLAIHKMNKMTKQLTLILNKMRSTMRGNSMMRTLRA